MRGIAVYIYLQEKNAKLGGVVPYEYIHPRTSIISALSNLFALEHIHAMLTLGHSVCTLSSHVMLKFILSIMDLHSLGCREPASWDTLPLCAPALSNLFAHT